LADMWESDSNWKRADVVETEQAFENLEGLSAWLDEEGNRGILAGMPQVVDLVPRKVLDTRSRAENLARELEDVSEVESVVYDRDGIGWLVGVTGGWRDAEGILRIALPLATLVLALLLGWTHSILFPYPSKSRGGWLGMLGTHWVSVAILAVCGLAAVALTTCLCGMAYSLTNLNVEFLTLSQIVMLLVLGAVAGVLTSVARFGLGQWMAPRVGIRATAGLALFILPCISAPALADTADALSVESALPALDSDAAFDLVGGLDNLNEEHRERLQKGCDRQIEKVDRLVRYLEEWMELTEEERHLDARNTEVQARKLKVALLELEASESQVAKRRRTLRGLSEALAPAHALAPGPIVPGNGDSRALYRTAQRLIARRADRALGLLDSDRAKLDTARSDAARLTEDSERLEAFGRSQKQTPEAILSERDRLLNERQTWVRRRDLLSATPQALAPAPRPMLALPKREADLGYTHLVLEGTLIHAVRGGKVLHAGPFTGLGNAVVLDHGNGMSSLYAFLADEIGVGVGQNVEAGQPVGAAGILKYPPGLGGIRFEARKHGKLAPPTSIQGLTSENIRLLLAGRKAN
jgi:Peptidase family M23